MASPFVPDCELCRRFGDGGCAGQQAGGRNRAGGNWNWGGRGRARGDWSWGGRGRAGGDWGWAGRGRSRWGSCWSGRGYGRGCRQYSQPDSFRRRQAHSLYPG